MWDHVSLQNVNTDAHRAWLQKRLWELLAQSGIRLSDENRQKTEAFVRELLPRELPSIY